MGNIPAVSHDPEWRKSFLAFGFILQQMILTRFFIKEFLSRSYLYAFFEPAVGFKFHNVQR